MIALINRQRLLEWKPREKNKQYSGTFDSHRWSAKATGNSLYGYNEYEFAIYRRETSVFVKTYYVIECTYRECQLWAEGLIKYYDRPH